MAIGRKTCGSTAASFWKDIQLDEVAPPRSCCSIWPGGTKKSDPMN